MANGAGGTGWRAVYPVCTGRRLVREVGNRVTGVQAGDDILMRICCDLRDL